VNQGFSNTPSGGSQNPKIQSFLEALRNSQGKVSSPSSESFSNPFAEFQNKKEIEKKRIESFHQARTQEWNRVFSSKQKETERKIEQIREDLKRLAKQVKILDTNIIKAIESPVVEAGEGQISFLEHIKKVIHDYSLSVTSANSWLETYNNRSKKKSYYWGQAAKRGTSFTQNNERTAATSVG